MGTHDGEGVVATAYEHNTGSYTETTSSAYSDKRTSKCRDPIFALLFVINVVGIIATASAYGKKAFDDDDDIQSTVDDFNTADIKAYVYMTLGCSGGAVVVTMAMFAIMMCIPQFLIKLAVFFNILCCAAIVFSCNHHQSDCVRDHCWCHFAYIHLLGLLRVVSHTLRYCKPCHCLQGRARQLFSNSSLLYIRTNLRRFYGSLCRCVFGCLRGQEKLQL